MLSIVLKKIKITELFVLKLSTCLVNNKDQNSLQIYFITLMSSHKRDISGAILVIYLICIRFKITQLVLDKKILFY